MGLLAAAALAVVMAGGSATASAQSSAGAHWTTVVSGLDNPRGLAFNEGSLYVAEAGHGGPNCLQGTCVGLTSAISRINMRAHTRTQVIDGFVSVAGSNGSGATGLDGISFLDDTVYGIETGAPQQVPPSGFPAWLMQAARNQLGRLFTGNVSTDHFTTAANVGGTDWEWAKRHANLVPGQFPDANPYGVLALPGVRWVVDAGSNTIDRVSPGGDVDVERFIPNPPASDAVPTCVARGSDGALYIGELTGGGNKPGSSIVWRFSPSTLGLTRWATGLTAVTGCGFGPGGAFYATEFSTLGLDKAAPGTGAVVRVPAHSTSPVKVVGGLSFPGGFAAQEGALYVSNWSVAPAHGPAGAPTGSVVRISWN